ncbi:hypothetical protein HaLaN_28703 [Haematococcus lacustris]|uniref:Uncharacterized protein n=1 Tax=Haematococcus lacustris TaxID=44745 RepID=A0A6A0ABB0_HAELA|nr:hypothetical protein HaLaN_28703 [Haematococcus lacustris]
MARHVVAPVRGMKYNIMQQQSRDWAAPHGCGAWPWRGWRALCALPMHTAYACTLRTAYACTLRTAYAHCLCVHFAHCLSGKTCSAFASAQGSLTSTMHLMAGV